MLLVTKGQINISDYDIILTEDLYDETEGWYNLSLKESLEEICIIKDIVYVEYTVDIEAFSKTKKIISFKAWTEDKIIFLIYDDFGSTLDNIDRNPPNEIS